MMTIVYIVLGSCYLMGAAWGAVACQVLTMGDWRMRDMLFAVLLWPVLLVTILIRR